MNFATRMVTPLLVIMMLVLAACQIERSPGEGPRVIEVDGTRLVIRGLDAYDKTPVLDIKVSMESLRKSGPHRPHEGAR